MAATGSMSTRFTEALSSQIQSYDMTRWKNKDNHDYNSALPLFGADGLDFTLEISSAEANV